MKYLYLTLGFLFSPAVAMAQNVDKPPIVFYHGVSQWNGTPLHPEKSGWNVVLPSIDPQGANTGALAFVMHWDAKNKCWGIPRDCRPPKWAVSQKVTYVGEVTTNYFTTEIKQ